MVTFLWKTEILAIAMRIDRVASKLREIKKKKMVWGNDIAYRVNLPLTSTAHFIACSKSSFVLEVGNRYISCYGKFKVIFRNYGS